jgi:hypothetical protein
MPVRSLDWRLMLLHDFENLVAQKRHAARHDHPDLAGGCAVWNDGRDFVRGYHGEGRGNVVE